MIAVGILAAHAIAVLVVRAGRKEESDAAARLQSVLDWAFFLVALAACIVASASLFALGEYANGAVDRLMLTVLTVEIPLLLALTTLCLCQDRLGPGAKLLRACLVAVSCCTLLVVPHAEDPKLTAAYARIRRGPDILVPHELRAAGVVAPRGIHFALAYHYSLPSVDGAFSASPGAWWLLPRTSATVWLASACGKQHSLDIGVGVLADEFARDELKHPETGPCETYYDAH